MIPTAPSSPSDDPRIARIEATIAELRTLLLKHSQFEIHKIQPLVANGLVGANPPYCIQWGPGPITVWQFFISSDSVVREHPIDTPEQVAAYLSAVRPPILIPLNEGSRQAYGTTQPRPS